MFPMGSQSVQHNQVTKQQQEGEDLKCLKIDFHRVKNFCLTLEQNIDLIFKTSLGSAPGHFLPTSKNCRVILPPSFPLPPTFSFYSNNPALCPSLSGDGVPSPCFPTTTPLHCRLQLLDTPVFPLQSIFCSVARVVLLQVKRDCVTPLLKILS